MTQNKLRVAIDEQFSLSRIVHGHWRLLDWKLTTNELGRLINQTRELGISTFDHADIYGDYGCETAFGAFLQQNKGIRQELEIISKCGIKLCSKKYPSRTLNHYDTSKAHILASAEQSLKNLQTDYLDVLLVHRPDPLMQPDEIAEAFHQLKTEGKVRYFGVSNFNASDFELLNTAMDDQLITNQIEVSPYCLEHFSNGNLSYLGAKKIKPMAWSPLAGGQLFVSDNEKSKRIRTALREAGNTMGIEDLAEIAYCWLLHHPSRLLPIVGSGKIERLKVAVDAMAHTMTRETWFSIYVAVQGHPVP